MTARTTPAVKNRVPANNAAGRFCTAILVNMNDDPHTRYTVPRQSISFVEWRELRKLEAARRSRAIC